MSYSESEVEEIRAMYRKQINDQYAEIQKLKMDRWKLKDALWNIIFTASDVVYEISRYAPLTATAENLKSQVARAEPVYREFEGIVNPNRLIEPGCRFIDRRLG